MLAEMINTPEEYLLYFEEVLKEAGIPESGPKIYNYYKDLCKQFMTIFYEQEAVLFAKWGQLLAIDAQLQILLELIRASYVDLVTDLSMCEDEIIHMIQRDQKSFYRELTGGKINQSPRWALIYLSEE